MKRIREIKINSDNYYVYERNRMANFSVTGKNLEKNLKEICLCAWPQLLQGASEHWYLATKCGSVQGDAGGDEQKLVEMLSSLILVCVSVLWCDFTCSTKIPGAMWRIISVWHPYFSAEMSLKTCKIKSS